MRREAQQTVNIAILGQEKVGKTQLFNRLTGTPFDDRYQATIAATFGVKSYLQSDKQEVKLEFWDTSGRERYRSLLPMYYRNAKAIIIVYRDKVSLENGKGYVTECRAVLPSVPVILVYNQFASEKVAQADEFAGKEWASTQENITFHRVNVREIQDCQPIWDDVCQRTVVDHKKALLTAFQQELGANGVHENMQNQGISGWNILLLPLFALFCGGVKQKCPGTVTLILQSDFSNMQPDKVTQTYETLRSRFQPSQGCFAMFSFRRKATQKRYNDFLRRMNIVDSGQQVVAR